jgi:hypothetical protein
LEAKKSMVWAHGQVSLGVSMVQPEDRLGGWKGLHSHSKDMNLKRRKRAREEKKRNPRTGGSNKIVRIVWNRLKQ